MGPEEIAREQGEIEILLGMDVIGLHPTEARTCGNQRMLYSQFGRKRLLVGAVPGQACSHLDINAVRLSQGSWELPDGAQVNHIAATVRVSEHFSVDGVS